VSGDFDNFEKIQYALRHPSLYGKNVLNLIYKIFQIILIFEFLHHPPKYSADEAKNSHFLEQKKLCYRIENMDDSKTIHFIKERIDSIRTGKPVRFNGFLSTSVSLNSIIDFHNDFTGDEDKLFPSGEALTILLQEPNCSWGRRLNLLRFSREKEFLMPHATQLYYFGYFQLGLMQIFLAKVVHCPEEAVYTQSLEAKIRLSFLRTRPTPLSLIPSPKNGLFEQNSKKRHRDDSSLPPYKKFNRNSILC
jgi:hypothetical protein